MIVDIFLIYSFLKRLTTPFDQTKAFRLGLIDAEGKRLKKAHTDEEKSAMGYFDRLVFNLKRLLAKVPGGSSQIATFAAALLLLREQDERLISDRLYLEEEFKKTLDSIDLQEYNTIMEDMGGAPANATGAAVVGTGDNQATWVKKRKKVLRRWVR